MRPNRKSSVTNRGNLTLHNKGPVLGGAVRLRRFGARTGAQLTGALAVARNLQTGSAKWNKAGRTLHLAPPDVIDAARQPELFGEGDQPDRHVQIRGIALDDPMTVAGEEPVGRFDREDSRTA